MEISSLVSKILSAQISDKKRIPVDVILKNGNLLIRSLHITRFNKINNEIEGITRVEGYSSLREKRDPVICRLRLDEIKELLCVESELLTV